MIHCPPPPPPSYSLSPACIRGTTEAAGQTDQVLKLNPDTYCTVDPEGRNEPSITWLRDVSDVYLHALF